MLKIILNIRLILFIFLILLITNCGSGGGNSVGDITTPIIDAVDEARLDEPGAQVISEISDEYNVNINTLGNTKVVKAGTIVELNETTGELSLSDSLDTVEIGAIIVGNEENPFLRKVVSSSTDSTGKLIMVTESAVLEDILQDGTLSLTINPQWTQVTKKSSVSNKKYATASDGTVNLNNTTLFNIKMENGSIDWSKSTILDVSYNDEPKSDDGNAKFNVSTNTSGVSAKILTGSFRFVPAATAEIDFGFLSVDSFETSFKGKVVYDIKVELSVSKGVDLLNFKKSLIKFKHPIIIPGTPPIYTELELDIAAGFNVEANVEGTFILGFNSQYDLETTMKYENEDWTITSNQSASFEPVATAEVTGVLKANIFLEPTVTFRFFKLAGPYISFKPYVEAGIEEITGSDITDSGRFFLNAGVSGKVGINAKSFSRTLLDVNKEIFDIPDVPLIYEKIIYNKIPKNIVAKEGDSKTTSTWDDIKDATSYNLYWSTEKDVTTSDTKLENVTSPYDHKELTNGEKYYYIVTAIVDANESGPSDEVFATPVGQVPDAPTNVVAVGSWKEIALTWDLVENATSYTIHFKDYFGVDITSVDIDDPNVEDVTSPYTFTNLVEGRDYYFVIVAHNKTGASVVSKEVTSKTLTSEVSIESAHEKITLSWNTSTGTSTYNVYWSSTKGVTTSDNKFESVSSPYVHTGLTNGLKYYYIVTEVTATEVTLPLEVFAVAGAVPDAPKNLSATPHVYNVTLTWDPVDGATSYNLYYDFFKGVSKSDDSSIKNITSPYKFTGEVEFTFFFVVTAVNDTGESLVSEDVREGRLSVNTKPDAIVSRGDSQNSLSWNDITEASSYNIYWSTNPDISTSDNKISTENNSYTHTNLTNGTKYYYAVSSVIESIESALSSEVSTTPKEEETNTPPPTTSIDGAYVVIDVSEGVNASSYTITNLTSVPSDLLTNTDGPSGENIYKYSKIILRKISAGSFEMGSEGEEYIAFTHQVTLTKDFFIGVFEITQKQYQLVMGVTPSSQSEDEFPVENVSWDDIRGGDWPNNSKTPNSGSFVDVLRSKTGSTFDLPTEAQWEYSCRAGTTKDFNNDTDNSTPAFENDPNLDLLGWYSENSNSDYHEAGLKSPNAWGLYDMHGNVSEFCLDRFTSYTASNITDPEGATSADNTSGITYRMRRGGAFSFQASFCKSVTRGFLQPDKSGNITGFRLALRP
ncbi:MAG: hypothetical protein COA79_09285 [Planctomycetota bacterium]|nr:MAG: hypothetical protein COA79_09285 [Planctomycetota bacterium]